MASTRKRAIWRKPAWRLDEVMSHCAVANVYVAAANRIGLEQYLPDNGNSVLGIFIAGPQE
jgi:adenosine/AMP kinase